MYDNETGEEYELSPVMRDPIYPFQEYFAKKVVGFGEESDLVRIIQIMLATLATQYDELLDISKDGKYGEQTKSAVSMIQRENNLAQTGEVDSETWNVLANLYNYYLEKE